MVHGPHQAEGLLLRNVVALFVRVVFPHSDLLHMEELLQEQLSVDTILSYDDGGRHSAHQGQLIAVMYALL